MRNGVVPSLDLDVEEIDGSFFVDAPWLDEPLEGDDWYVLFREALRRRPR